MRKINHSEYIKSPEIYSLISGDQKGAPLCPYGNTYRWIGYDHDRNEYVRFTKSIFKRLIKNINDV